MKPSLKFLHFSDVHLGAKFQQWKDRGVAQRERLRQVLEELTQLAIQERVDLVLTSGDLFDHNRPSPESLSAVDRAQQQFHNAHIPWLIIAGTHDCLGPDSALRRLSLGSGWVLLTPENPIWTDPNLGLTVQGVSLLTADTPARPLATLRRGLQSGWQIGMAHAGLEIGGQLSKEAVFSAEEIAATQLDYLALGHWHSPQDLSRGSVTAWYAGAPELIARDQTHPGSALLVELKPDLQPVVQVNTLGQHQRVRVQVDAHSLPQMTNEVQSLTDPKHILEVNVTGVFRPEERPDWDAFRLKWEPHFFQVLLNDQSGLSVDDEVLSQYPEQTVAGRLIRLGREGINQAKTLGERLEQEEALQLGLALLLGREVEPWSSPD